MPRNVSANELRAPFDIKAREGLVRARYGEDSPKELAWSDAIELMMGHRSVRSYRNDPLPAGTLEGLIAAAQSAATSSNMQSWSVVAIEDQPRRDRMAALAGGQAHISQCPLFLVFLADISRHERVAAGSGRKLYSDYVEMFVVATIDAALAAQNAALAAESLGLATLFVGAMRNDPVALAQELNLPEKTVCVFGLCVGYADDSTTAAIKPRLPQSAVLHRELYDISRESESLQRYDETLRRFTKTYDSSAYSWTERLYTRMADMSYLQGRERFRFALLERGFPLL
ncbi:nitroreductase family protein [Bradyrhizobium japonicum]|uniref:nitroreductase family protein n=1 Tax=Bradyrhizobium japonicum TaxID=375 RepID=UPI0004BCAB5E|nr:nitroreductase family protein [Bradyrhizobium japonicum]